MRERYDELGLRQLLRDAELLVERVALSVASGDHLLHAVVRRHGRAALPPPVRPDGRPDRAVRRHPRGAARASCRPTSWTSADEALDEAIEVYRWHRRLAGDARKKNAFLQFLYKGG